MLVDARMRTSIDYIARGGLALVVLVLSASAWMADDNTRRLVQNESWIKHTYNVLVGVDGLLAILLDAETGQRGYLLTGERRYLQPYQVATPQVGNVLVRLAADTADNPSQRRRLSALQGAVGEYLALLAATLDEGGTTSRGRQRELLDRGKQAMDAIREQVAAMRQEELSLLSARMQRSSDSFHKARLVFFGTTIVTTALVILTYGLLRRDIVGRRRAHARLEAANLRLREGLRAAAKVQASLLPPLRVQVREVKFAWAFLPCEELAGDALNICSLANGEMAVYLLDVSGHGAAAALSAVAVVQALTPTHEGSRLALGVESPVRPDEVLRALDRHFTWDDGLGQFFTICYGIVDPVRQEFRYSSAGHPAPILVRIGEPPVFLDTPAGLPVGLGGDFDISTIPLRRGDRLYIYSDGVTETVNVHGEFFGGQRLLDACARCRDTELEETIQSLLDEMRDWRGKLRARDDVSLVAVEIGC